MVQVSLGVVGPVKVNLRGTNSSGREARRSCWRRRVRRGREYVSQGEIYPEYSRCLGGFSVYRISDVLRRISQGFPPILVELISDLEPYGVGVEPWGPVNGELVNHCI
ncbi:hypothetical protein ES703_109082 [subsurface metagenome]